MTQTNAENPAHTNGAKGKGTSPKFGVRLPPDIRALLNLKAKAAGLSESALIRALIEDAPVVAAADQTAARQTHAQLARIGNNLNQLARHANGWRGNADAERLAAEVAAIRTELHRIFAAPSGMETPEC